MEALGLLMDFHGQRIKFMDGTWQEPTRGRHGEYLLSLTGDYQPGAPVNQLDFDLVVPDDDVTMANEVVTFPTFKLEETAFEVTDSPVTPAVFQPGERALRRHQLRTMEVRVSAVFECFGLSTERFGLDTGWDFDNPDHRSAFLRRLRDEQPDEVYLAPICGPWSQMQNLAARTNE